MRETGTGDWCEWGKTDGGGDVEVVGVEATVAASGVCRDSGKSVCKRV